MLIEWLIRLRNTSWPLWLHACVSCYVSFVDCIRQIIVDTTIESVPILQTEQTGFAAGSRGTRRTPTTRRSRGNCLYSFSKLYNGRDSREVLTHPLMFPLSCTNTRVVISVGILLAAHIVLQALRKIRVSDRPLVALNFFYRYARTTTTRSDFAVHYYNLYW